MTLRFSFILIIILTIVNINLSQHPTCNGTRYVSQEFISSDTTVGVLYGNNTTFGGNNQDLFMDIFEPTGDLASKRPVVVLAFGGSGIGGTRQDVHELCDYYTKRGFVSVAIDYRLYDGPFFPFPSSSVWTDVIIKGVSDLKAAIRYLKEDAATTNNFRIDSNYIFTGGINIGSILVSHAAYLDSTDSISTDVSSAISANGGWTGNSSTNFQYSSEIHGVINFSGALIDTTYISNNESPLFSVHDDMDETIPYASGNVQVFGTPMLSVHGSQLMHQKATLENIKNKLITIPSSTDHVSYFQANSAIWEDSVKSESCVFLNEIICPPSNTTSTLNITSCDSYISPSGNNTWTSSNTYMDTIPNNSGGDSIITINLTIHNSSSSTITETACESYTSPSGNYTWTSSNTYLDTIPNSVNCDSIITINLTIHNSSSSTITETACESYTSPSGNYTWTSSNTYIDTIPNSVNCDSIITINLTIQNLDLSVNQSGNILTSNESGATYQWLDCNGMTPIAGGQSQSYTATENGDYAVIISNFGCSDTSVCNNITQLGITKTNLNKNLEVYPNPTDGNLSIDLGEKYYSSTITISDINGKLIMSKNYNKAQFLKLHFDAPSGVYFLKVQSENKNNIIKLIKE